MNQYKNDLIAPEQLYPLIGKNIKHLRLQRGMTQEQLAELIDGDQKYISKIEAGKARPGLTVYLQLANIFQVSIDRFLADAMEMEHDTADGIVAQQVIQTQAGQKLAHKLVNVVVQYLQEKE